MRKSRKIIKIIVFSFLLSFIMSFVSVPLGFYSGFTGADYEVLSTDKLYTVISLIGEISLLLFMLAYYNKKKTERTIVMPFEKTGALKKYVLGYVSGSILFFSIWLIAVFLGGFTVTTIFTSQNLIWVFLFFIGYGIQGMAEEILCRGYLQGRLTQEFNAVFGILISSFFFAFLHIGNPGLTLIALLELFLFGAIMAIIRYKKNSLWFISAAHSAWNFVQGPVLGVPVSGTNSQAQIFSSIPTKGNAWLNGGSFGIEGSILCVIIFLIVLIFVLWWAKKTKTVDISVSFS